MGLINNFAGVMLMMFFILGLWANLMKFIKVYMWWIQPTFIAAVSIGLIFIVTRKYYSWKQKREENHK